VRHLWGHQAARRHFSRVRPSNRSTLRTAGTVVNHPTGRHADKSARTARTLVFLRAL
jgi:hypothetical protein